MEQNANGKQPVVYRSSYIKILSSQEQQEGDGTWAQTTLGINYTQFQIHQQLGPALPCPGLPRMEQGQWGWSCCPVPGWDGIFCCKTCCAPAEGSRHQGKKPSRESASHEKEVLKTAWKQPGSASAGSSRAGSSGDRQVSLSIYLFIRLSIHSSIYLLASLSTGADSCQLLGS